MAGGTTMSQTLQGILSVLGRTLLCAIFLLDAYKDVTHFDDAVRQVEMKGIIPLPRYAVMGTITFFIVGSLLVVTGFWARFGALLLFVFLVPATAYFHAFWDHAVWDPSAEKEKVIELMQFMKNVGLMGAMLFILANGPGRWSLGGRRAEEPKKM
jgi:putative oxidoreductase